MATTDIPEALKECVDKFWNDNPELRHQILRDLYVNGVVSYTSNLLGQAAVDIWLHSVPNGER